MFQLPNIDDADDADDAEETIFDEIRRMHHEAGMSLNEIVAKLRGRIDASEIEGFLDRRYTFAVAMREDGYSIEQIGRWLLCSPTEVFRMLKASEKLPRAPLKVSNRWPRTAVKRGRQ